MTSSRPGPKKEPPYDDATRLHPGERGRRGVEDVRTGGGQVVEPLDLESGVDRATEVAQIVGDLGRRVQIERLPDLQPICRDRMPTGHWPASPRGAAAGISSMVPVLTASEAATE